MFSLFFLPFAFAESPSPLNKGAYSLYGSVGYGHWNQFSNGEVNSSQNISGNIQNTEIFSSVSIGVTDFMDISLQIPFRFVWAGSDAPKTDLFTTTIGIGRMNVGTKILINPEGGLLPFTLSLYSGIRNGSFHSQYRERMTNLGEGTVDIGTGLQAGKVGFLGTGFFWVEGAGYFWFRQPITMNTTYPNNEISYSFELGYSFHPNIAIASCTYGYERMGGLDYPTLAKEPSLDDIDQWAALDASQIKTGVKLNYYMSDTVTSNLQFLYSVYSKNNPSNEYYVSVGLNYFHPQSL